MTREELEMFDWFNEARRTKGLINLKPDDRLADIARVYSGEQKENFYISHVSAKTGTPQDRMRAGGYFFGMSAENLAMAPTTIIAFTGLMNSPGHYANIMNAEATHSGIGIDYHQGKSTYFVTQLFAVPVPMYNQVAVTRKVNAILMKERVSKGLPILSQISFPKNMQMCKEIETLVEAIDDTNKKKLLDLVKESTKTILPKGASYGLGISNSLNTREIINNFSIVCDDPQIKTFSMGLFQSKRTRDFIVAMVFW